MWRWKYGEKITTQNGEYIPRFQELCEDFGIPPTYLTNYEMALDPFWVNYGKRKVQENKCEIGMHLHAWNTPPEFPLENRYGGNSYITEYDEDIIRQKVSTLGSLLSQTFEIDITSNRSGRWATNEVYFHSLVDQGVFVDCSVTPGLNLSKIPGCSLNCGNDYREYGHSPFEIFPGLLEVPMTTKRLRFNTRYGIKQFIRTLIKGEDMWLRPIPKNERTMRSFTQSALKKYGYIELMLHSSELMPGGSPYFQTAESIEHLYSVLREYFTTLMDYGIKAISLSQYAKEYGASND